MRHCGYPRITNPWTVSFSMNESIWLFLGITTKVICSNEDWITITLASSKTLFIRSIGNEEAYFWTLKAWLKCLQFFKCYFSYYPFLKWCSDELFSARYVSGHFGNLKHERFLLKTFGETGIINDVPNNGEKTILRILSARTVGPV